MMFIYVLNIMCAIMKVVLVLVLYSYWCLRLFRQVLKTLENWPRRYAPTNRRKPTATNNDNNYNDVLVSTCIRILITAGPQNEPLLPLLYCLTTIISFFIYVTLSNHVSCAS